MELPPAAREAVQGTPIVDKEMPSSKPSSVYAALPGLLPSLGLTPQPANSVLDLLV